MSKINLFDIFRSLIKIPAKSVALKIAVILVFMSLITVILSYIGITKIHDMNQVANDIFFSNTSVLFPLSDISDAVYQIETALAASASENDQVAVAGLYSNMQNLSGMVDNLSSVLSGKEMATVETHLKKYRSGLQDCLTQDANNSSFKKSYAAFLHESQAFHNILYQINKEMRIKGMATYNKGKNIYSSVVLLQIWLTVLGVALAVFIGSAVAFSIIRPLQQLRNTTKLLAQGDLRARADLKSNDEVGAVASAFNQAINELRTMVTEAAVKADNIFTSCSELFKATDETSRSLGELNKLVEELANGAITQTTTVESTIQSVQKATENAASLTQTTLHINDACKEASIAAERGEEAASEMINTINILVETVNSINGMVQNFTEDSAEIGKIVDVISDIAEKTGLLSINASIEAARAGEYGHGFAVVATNIRQLAIQSQESVQRIDEVINNIFVKTDRAIAAMEKEAAQVDKGRQKLIETAGLFQELIKQVDQIIASIGLITETADQMNENNQRVIKEMARVSRISQDNLAAVEEVSATFQEQYGSTMMVNDAAGQLRKMAEQLAMAANRFNI